MLRAIGAIVAGLLAAVVLIAAVDFVAHAMYAPEQPIDRNDPDATARFIASLPPTAFAIIVFGWAAGSFVGAYVAARTGRSAAYGFVIGALILVATIATLMMAPHPGWVWFAGIVIVVVNTFIAIRSALPARKTAT